MATVSTISIKLDAQTATLKKGFADTQKAVGGLGKKLTSDLGAGFIKFNAVIDATRNALGLVKGALAGVFETVERFADMTDFADRIQINVERLNELRLVTEQFGGSAGAMNTSLQRMTRRLGEAATRGGPIAERMAELGYNINAIGQMSPDQQFRVMADAISKLGTAGEQAALAMQVMDTEGVGLLDTLRLGSDELKDQMELMGEHSTFSEQQGRDAQALSANLKLLSDSWSGLKDQIVMHVVPALSEFVKWLDKTVQRVGDLYFKYRKMWAKIWGGDLEAAPQRAFESPDELLDIATAGPIKALSAVEEKAVKAVKAVKMEMMSIPGVGAVTASSSAGFSALQDAKRRSQAREAWEKEMKALTEASVAALETVAANLLLVPVSIS